MGFRTACCVERRKTAREFEIGDSELVRYNVRVDDGRHITVQKKGYFRSE